MAAFFGNFRYNKANVERLKCQNNYLNLEEQFIIQANNPQPEKQSPSNKGFRRTPQLVQFYTCTISVMFLWAQNFHKNRKRFATDYFSSKIDLIVLIGEMKYDPKALST